MRDSREVFGLRVAWDRRGAGCAMGDDGRGGVGTPTPCQRMRLLRTARPICDAGTELETRRIRVGRIDCGERRDPRRVGE